jgi:hypothetical protein
LFSWPELNLADRDSRLLCLADYEADTADAEIQSLQLHNSCTTGWSQACDRIPLCPLWLASFGFRDPGTFCAYRLELDSGFWAGITAAVVCQPSLGASLRKARVRAVGTIIGAVVIRLLTSAFQQNRPGLLLGLALWIGVCEFFATILRHFASYGAALAGFTTAVIFADVINAPGNSRYLPPIFRG